jgi:FkbM family methyltransferase
MSRVARYGMVNSNPSCARSKWRRPRRSGWPARKRAPYDGGMVTESNDAHAAPERRFLSALAAVGEEPRIIYDIGAAGGGWSESIAVVCPDADYHLFEPLADALPAYRAKLADRLARMPRLTLHAVAIGARTGRVVIHVADDGWGSSLVDMSGQSNFAIRLTVPEFRLDDYVLRHDLPWPDLIKMDTQATEDRVIAGAGQALAKARIVMIETWLSREYGKDTPLLTELMVLLEHHGHRLCALGTQYHDQQHRVYGVDAIFAKADFLAQIAPAMPEAAWSGAR